MFGYAYQLASGQVVSDVPKLRGNPLLGQLPFMLQEGFFALADEAHQLAATHPMRASSFWLGHFPVLYLSDKNHIRQLLESERDGLATRGKALEGLEATIGYGNVFSVAKRDEWKQLRNLHAPVFLQNSNLDKLFTVLQQVISKNLERKNGQTIELTDFFVHLTMEVVTQTTMGLPDDFTDEQIKALSNAITDIFTAMLNPANLALKSFNEALAHYGISPIENDLSRSGAQLQASIQQNIMDAHDKAATKDYPHDLIQQLREFHEGDAEKVLRDVSMVFIAGHETTSRLATFLIVLLGSHPDAYQKIQHEITCLDKPAEDFTRQDLEACHYLRACVAETLRLYPPVPHIAREVLQPLTLHDTNITIQPGTLVLMSHYHLQHDEHFFDNPNQFKPERFLNNATFQDKNLSQGYFPFGHGERKCLGRQFAIYEAMATIAQMISKFEIQEISAKHPLELDVPGTLKPKHEVTCHLAPRHQLADKASISSRKC